MEEGVRGQIYHLEDVVCVIGEGFVLGGGISKGGFER